MRAQVASAGTLTLEELWQWDTSGYLVLPGVMDARWLAAANSALDAVGETEGGEMPTSNLPDAWWEQTSDSLAPRGFPASR